MEDDPIALALKKAQEKVSQPTQPTAPVTQPAAPVTQPAAPVTQPAAPVTQPAAPVTQPAQPTAPVTQPAAPAAPAGNNPPPPRAPSEAQRYNSAARTADTTVAMYNPRGLGNQSKYKQSQGNVVPGSLQAKVEAERAIGKSDPWTGWNVRRNETRPVLHSMKGADGTTYYQQIDGKAGTARYWSVDSSGNRTEYTGDDKVSARDQINAARKNADLEAKKNYWRSRGVQFGETDEKGNFTGKFENLTAEGARAEYERKFGDAERALRNGLTPEGMSQEAAQRALDQARFEWSKSGGGREQYNWMNKLDQTKKIDWDQEARRATDRYAAEDHAEAVRQAQAHPELHNGPAARRAEAYQALARSERARATRDSVRQLTLDRAAKAQESWGKKKRDEAADRAIASFNESMTAEANRALGNMTSNGAPGDMILNGVPEPQEEVETAPVRMSPARARLIERYGTPEQKAELAEYRSSRGTGTKTGPNQNRHMGGLRREFRPEDLF